VSLDVERAIAIEQAGTALLGHDLTESQIATGVLGHRPHIPVRGSGCAIHRPPS
jgi:hypothetical protein